MSLHRERVHQGYVEGCFGCKASTLSFSDIQIRTVAHRNERELDAYANARRQGIQPRSTRISDVQTAVRASDALGKAVKA